MATKNSVSAAYTGVLRGLYSGQMPDNTIAYLNWTGEWDDGPAPSSKVEAEMRPFLAMLRKNKIPFKRVIRPTGSIFCMRVCILTDGEHRAQATELALEHQTNTELFTVVRRTNNA